MFTKFSKIMHLLLLCAIMHNSNRCNCESSIKSLDRHMKLHNEINIRNQYQSPRSRLKNWPFSFSSPNKDDASNFDEEIGLVEGTNSRKPIVVVYDRLEPLPIQIGMFPKKGSDEKKGNGIITYNAHQQATNQTEVNGDIMIANVTKGSKQSSDQVDLHFLDDRDNLTSSLPKDNESNPRVSKMLMHFPPNNKTYTFIGSILALVTFPSWG